MTDNAQETEVQQMAAAGLSVKAIAAELKISEGTVRNLLGTRPEGTPQTSGHDEQAIVDNYQNGTMQVRAILETHGISYTTLYTILAKHDVPVRAVSRREGREAQLDAAVEMYKQGASLFDIRQDTGVHQPTLHQELHLRNVPLRNKRGGAK